MPRITWDPDAEEDLRTIAYYIGVERQSPRGARSVVDSVREKCGLYAQQPEMGQLRLDLHPEIRIFGVGNYVVLYFATEDGIYVARVFEGHRDYPALFGPELGR